jgi:hypothetical protein
VLLEVAGVLLAFGIVLFWWGFGRTKALPPNLDQRKGRIRRP